MHVVLVQVLPYTSLLHKPTRQSLGVDLRGSVVILDEAHNIIETINAVHSAEVRLAAVSAASEQLGLYLERYRGCLNGKNLLYINQIRHVLKALLQFCTARDAEADRSVAVVGSPASATGGVSAGGSAGGSRCGTKDGLKAISKEVYPINDFLFALGIDNVNLLKLERYLEASGLPNKLLGFSHARIAQAAKAKAKAEAKGGMGLTQGNEVPEPAVESNLSTHVSPLSVVHRCVRTR